MIVAGCGDDDPVRRVGDDLRVDHCTRCDRECWAVDDHPLCFRCLAADRRNEHDTHPHARTSDKHAADGRTRAESTNPGV